MKIISQDASSLLAQDKAIGQFIGAIVTSLVGVGMSISGFTGGNAGIGWVGLAVVAAGVLFLITSKQRTLSVDKTSGQLNFSVKSLISKANRSYAISDVAKLEFSTELQTSTTSAGSGRSNTGLSLGGNRNSTTTQHTQLHLMLKNGEVISLADGQRSMSSLGVFSKIPNLEVGLQIAAFLGVPFKELGGNGVVAQPAAPAATPPVVQAASSSVSPTPPSVSPSATAPVVPIVTPPVAPANPVSPQPAPAPVVATPPTTPTAPTNTEDQK